MFKVEGVISSFFQLALGIPFKTTLDVINKGLRVFKIFLEESFEIRTYDKNNVFVIALILGPFEADNATKI